MDVSQYPVRVYEDDQISKGYRKLVFKPGAPSASSEMNETQQIVNYNLSQLASSIYPDATIISGGFKEIVDITKEDGTEAKEVYFSSTKTQIDGNVFNIPECSIEITGQGDEIVGFFYNEKYITSADDPSLLNPAIGTANYGSPGADRIKVTVVWSKTPTDESKIDSNSKFFPVYTFVFGVLQTLTNSSDDEKAKLLNLLATYNYSANGSFVTTGMEVQYLSDSQPTTDPATGDAIPGRHVFEFTAGEAFVEGYQISNKFNQRFYINWLEDIKSINNEPHTFTSDGPYKLNWYPIANITEIDGEKEFTATISRSVLHTDRINEDFKEYPVLEIESVSRTANGSDAFPSTAYKQSGDYIDWTGSTNQPSAGETYYIKFKASYTVSPHDPNAVIDKNDKNRQTIQIAGLIPGSRFRVDYTFYLKRIDRVVLNRDGSLSILTGVPHDTNPKPSYNASGLSIALVRVSRAITPEVTIDTNKVYKMSDIRRLANKVDNNEYNISVLALKDEIRSDMPVSNKSNMIVDSFMNDNGRDAGRVQNAQTTGRSLMSGFNTDTRLLCSGKPILLEYTEVVEQQNEAASKTRSVNIYSTINPNELGVLEINPSKYSWVANETIREQHGYNSNRSSFASGSQGSGSYGQNWRWMQNADYSTYNDTITREGLVLPIPNAPKLTVNASMFGPNEECDLYLDVVANFSGGSSGAGMGEGTHVANNRNLASSANAKFATVRANADGLVVNAQVDLPDFITTGSRKITIRGKTTGATATTTFVAEAHSIDATVTFWYSSDPLAQTYIASENCFITSVEVFVDALPTSYVDVLLAHTIVGFPDHEQAYNQKRLYKNQMKIGQWNKFKFDTPSYIEGNQLESFMVATSDDAAKIRCSELGHYDPYQKVWITKQGYAAGSLLESSDAKTWSPIHSEDITFRINKAYFKYEREVELGVIKVTKATDFILSTISQIYSGTNITYRVHFLDKKTDNIMEISAGTTYSIPTYTGEIKVYATLRTINPSISPVLFGDVTFTSMSRIWPSNYITRAFDVVPSGKAKINVSLDQYMPSGTSIAVSYLKRVPNDSTNAEDREKNPVIDKFFNMPLTKTKVIIGDIARFDYEAEVDNLTQTQIQIVLNVNKPDENEYNPYCENLRIVVNPVANSPD